MTWREAFTKELHSELAATAERLAGSTTIELTRELTQSIVAVLDRTGWIVTREMGVRTPRFQGCIDLVARRSSSVRTDIAIEIDRSHKLRSLLKLEEMARRGAFAVWVRWGRPIDPAIRAFIPSTVTMIEVPVTYRRSPRNRSRSAVGDVARICPSDEDEPYRGVGS